jgi:hypothetical protein
MLHSIISKFRSVMAGLVPAMHALLAARNVRAAAERKTWVPATSAGMTSVLIALACMLGVREISAQQRPNRLEIWDLKLGMSVTDLPDEFTDYACGNNGGPPSTALTGWKDFKRCRPEPGGLHEVYFRYDDELEYWAKANQFATEIRKFSGTKVFDFPVVLSARFDDNGILKGIRIVSDPRDTSRDREEAYLLRNFLNARYGREDWDCVDLPAEDGETPVFRTFIKQRCKKTVEGGALAELATSYLRKKGQAEIDPHSGRQTEGQFESLVRFELTMPR